MNDEKEFIKPRGWVASLNAAIEGIISAFKAEKHMKVHFALAAVALFASILLKVTFVEFALFAVSIVILLFAELMNTAVEEVVNLLETKKNVIAKRAKDISAGAVLVSSIGVAVTGYMVLTKYLSEPAASALKRAEPFAGHIAAAALLLVFITVVVVKALGNKRGRPLRGGFPSGHAAVAFSLATSIALITLDPFAALFSLGLALMVSASRLAGKIHTRVEVAAGALLGFGLTLGVYKLFHVALR